LEAEDSAREPRLTGRPDLLEAIDERTREVRIVGDERCARLLDMEAVQEVPAVHDDQRIGGAFRFGTGLVDRDAVAETAEEGEQAWTRRFEPARVVNDDLELRGPRGAQERRELFRAGRRVPAHLGKIVVEDSDRVLGQRDEIVERGDLLAHGRERLLPRFWR